MQLHRDVSKFTSRCSLHDIIKKNISIIVGGDLEEYKAIAEEYQDILLYLLNLELVVIFLMIIMY